MRKVIVISLGTDAVGIESARALAKYHTVVMLSSDPQKLKKRAVEIGCHYITCDSTCYKNCLSAINQIVAIQGKIDCLINNAEIQIDGKLEDCDPADIEHTMRINMLGTLFLTKAVIPSMKKYRRGKIINVISQDKLYVNNEKSVYAASQLALTGFTKSLQLELNPYGISVTGIYVDNSVTAKTEKHFKEKVKTEEAEPSDVAKAISLIIDLSKDTHIPELGIKHV